MLWADLYEAFAHSDAHTIMGRRLRPFCPYYYLWLKMIDSPILSGGKSSVHDFDIAARICSSPYGKAHLAVKPPAFPKLHYGWRMFFIKKYDVEAQFRAYLDDYCSPPDRSKTNDNVGDARESFPYPIWLVTGLMLNSNMSKEEAWMTPLGEAEWYMSGFDLNKGQNPHILTGHDREFMAEMKKQGVKPKLASENKQP